MTQPPSYLPAVFLLLMGVILFGVLVPGCGTNAESEEISVLYTSGKSDRVGGTGRFYMGREIASVQAEEEHDTWLDRAVRENAEFPDRVIQALELRPADVVADIGAGTGYYTFRLSAMVPHGRVYAVDIEADLLEQVTQKADAEGIRNIVPVLGTVTDPNLPAQSLDLALIVISYHQFSNPYEMMRHLVRALKPGGRLILVEYRGEDSTIPVPPLYRMTEEQATREMERVGLSWRETQDILPQQHFMVFEKPLE